MQTERPTPRLAPGLLGTAARAVLRAWKLVMLICLLLIPLLLVVAYVVATHITQRMLDGEIARLRRAGEPITLAELAPSVPAFRQNAADLYEQAFASLQWQSEVDDLGLYGSDPWEDEELAIARQFVEANGEYFGLLDEAARLPDCAFPADWSAGPDMLFPHYSEMRQAARALTVRTRLLSAQGKSDETLDSVITTIGIGEHAKLEPTLIGQLVGYAVQGIGLKAAEMALSDASPSPGACRRAFDRLAEIEYIGPFVAAMKGERLFGLDLYDRLRAGGYSVLGTGLAGEEESIGRYVTFGRPLVNLDALSYLQLMQKQIEAVSLPIVQAQGRLLQVADGWQEIPGYCGVVSSMVTPVFGRAVRSRDEKTASLGAFQIVLALKAYRTEHGHYPASLSDVEADG